MTHEVQHVNPGPLVTPNIIIRDSIDCKHSAQVGKTYMLLKRKTQGAPRASNMAACMFVKGNLAMLLG